MFLKAVADAGDVDRVMRLGISGTPMPSYSSALSDAEIHDVAAFTASLWAIEPRDPAPAIPLGSTAMTGDASSLALGERTFFASCAGCHGKAARGDGAATDLLATQPASFVAGALKLKSVGEGYLATVDDLRRTIRRGVPGTSMPSWPFHSEAEVDALAHYLREIAGPRTRPGGALLPAPSAPAGRLGTPASVARGAEVFKVQCVACHGETGRGDGVLAAMLRDFRGEKLRPRNFVVEPLKTGPDPAAVFRTISYGFEGTPMTGFAAAIPEADRWDLVSYVLSLAAPALAATNGGAR